MLRTIFVKSEGDYIATLLPKVVTFGTILLAPPHCGKGGKVMRKPLIAVALGVISLLALAMTCQAASTVKIRGYVTARPDEQTIKILDDVIALDAATQFELTNNSGGPKMMLKDVSVGTLVEAEGTWSARHRFTAKKITCDAAQFEKQIHGRAYLDRDPPDAAVIGSGQKAILRADGETLVMAEKTDRSWPLTSPELKTVAATEPARAFLVGRQVRYEGVRLPDGNISVKKIELGEPAAADAYRNPDKIQVVRTTDKQTGIDILEFRRGEKKVEGRMKLFPVKQVQEYVSELGRKLLPPSADITSRALEFRFFVVEDPHINAAALPDGTILINTGLLGAMDSEAELALVISHEIAHVLQAHYWREVHETRTKRVLITIAAIAGSGFVGDLSLFLGQLGLASVVNGYSRDIENQADRIGLQNVIALGYDPRAATGFFNTMVERYRDRSTSALWSNHDSSLLRGSFLNVQLARQYPENHFDKAVADTEQFKAMKEAMGPVKIM